MLAISVSARLFYDFFKTISENEVEKLGIYAIVIHGSGLFVLNIKDLSVFNILQVPTISINSGNLQDSRGGSH